MTSKITAAMKVDEKLLLFATKLVSTAVSNRPAQPILGNVLLKVCGEKLRLTGFDLRNHITAEIDMAGQDEFDCAVSQKPFLGLVSKLQSEPIELKKTSKGLSISHGNGDYRLGVMNADDYPELPEESMSWYDFEVLDFIELMMGIEFASHTSSGDSTKQILQGVNLSVENDILSIAATDGHQLSVLELPKHNLPSDLSITVDIGALEAIKLITEQKSEIAQIGIGCNMMGFRFGGYQILSRLIEGRYPMYRQLIPDKFLTKISISTEELYSAVIRVLTVSPSTSIVKLSLADGELLVDTKSETGVGKEFLLCHQTEGSGDTMFAANGKYLAELLATMKKAGAENVEICCNSPTSPVVFNAPAKLILIMPVELRE